MMVLDVVGIGCVATSRQRFDVVVLLVLLQFLVLGIAQYHLSKDAGRVGARFPFVHQCHRVLLLLLLVKIGQEAELIEGFILVEVVQLARYLLTVQSDQCRQYLPVRSQIDDNRYIRASDVHRITDADGHGAAG